MAIEQTVAMVKPCGVRHNLVHRIMCFYKQEGLSILDIRVFIFTIPAVMEFYKEHASRSFYPSLIHHMTSGPVVAFLLEGEAAITLVRELNGATNPIEAHPHSIRGQAIRLFDRQNPAANFVHGSDSPTAAAREAKLLKFI
jgi:nucleoside-diphosphate kinase